MHLARSLKGVMGAAALEAPDRQGSRTVSPSDVLPRIGILWRGDRSAKPRAPEASHGLGPLFEEFAKLPVLVEPLVFEDEAVEAVRSQLLGLDGVLVWVNPIQDDANRQQLDTLLREASALGIYVTADPDVIVKLGTKEVLFHTRHFSWGSDTDLYRTAAEFALRFPARLSEHRRLVVKQARGNGGNGVWKVELLEPSTAVGSDSVVRIQDARSRDGSSEQMRLDAFVTHCEQYFAWSGCLIDQEFQARLEEGMVRCYFSHDEVVGFCHQWPKGLLDMTPGEAAALASPGPSLMEGPDTPAYQPLRTKAETEWVPQMTAILGIGRESLPVIWDADFLYGPKGTSGEDTYVLCEINVSAVWPFPPMGSETVARAALARVIAARDGRHSTN